MKHKLISALALVSAVYYLTMPLGARIIEQKPFNVPGMDLFESFEHNARVYVCYVFTRKPSSSESDSNTERGTVTLNVIRALRSTNQAALYLPYAFIRSPGISMDAPNIWPQLHDFSSNMLCVVVPNAQDPCAPTIPGINEAASMVVALDNNEGAVPEMETICKLYDSQATPEFIKELKDAVASPQLTLRAFALETTIMKLGKTNPDEALEIIRSIAADYSDPPKHLSISKDPLDENLFAMYMQNAGQANTFDSERLFSYIGGGFLKLGQRNRFAPFYAAA